MLRIAIKMLLGDRIKYLMLISALAFSTFLITQQVGIFCGVMRLTTGIVRNTNVPIWVVDPYVEQAEVVKTLREVDLSRVRSVPGVEWAVPLFNTLSQATLFSGKFFTVQLVGVDSGSLIGVSPNMIEGDLRDLQQDRAVIVDEIGLRNLSEGREKPVGVGDEVVINDHVLKVVGIVAAEPSFFSYPIIYTTFERAVEITPPVRQNMGYILVQPKEGVEVDQLRQAIYQETGFRAFSADELSWSTMWWVSKHVGIPVSFALTSFLGFVVGMAVAGQTFYAFINENLPNIGALKAMGISHSLLQGMLLVQAFVAGFIGYGIGILFSVLFGFFLLIAYKVVPLDVPFYMYIPFYLPWQVFLVSFAFIVIICLMTVYLGIRRVNKLEPAEVFHV